MDGQTSIFKQLNKSSETQKHGKSGFYLILTKKKGKTSKLQLMLTYQDKLLQHSFFRSKRTKSLNSLEIQKLGNNGLVVISIMMIHRMLKK